MATTSRPKSRASVEQQKVLTLWLLKQSGPYEDDKGRAIAKLFEDYQSYGGNRELRSFATMVAALEDEGCVLRDIPKGAKRTLSVVLVDLKGYADKVAALGDSQPQKAQPAPASTEATTPVPSPTLERVGPSAADVASELLDRVVAILDRPGQFEINQQSLRETREQAEGYRRKLVDAERELVDLRRKLADATRKQLQAETNLATVVKDKGAAVRHDTVKALDRVMRQTPTGKGE